MNEEFIKEQYDWKDLLAIVEKLRAPDGCPWDREQTHESMIHCLLDESKEVEEAVGNKDYLNLREELGDILLQVLLHAEIAKENDEFTLDDVINQLAKKMVIRHPHVFGGSMEAKNAQEGLSNWNYIKREEKLARLREYEEWVKLGKIDNKVKEQYETILRDKGYL